MTYFANTPKWAYSDPERYGLTDPHEGLVCDDCEGKGFVTVEHHEAFATQVVKLPCPVCQGTRTPR